MFLSIYLLFLGYLLVNLINCRTNFLEKIGIGFMIGIGVVTLFVFSLTFFNIRLNVINVSFLLTSLLSFLLLLNIFYKKLKIRQKIYLPNIASQKSWRLLLLFLIAFLVMSSLLSNLYWPVRAWDALAVYDARAIVYASGGLLSDLWEQSGKAPLYFGYYYSSYPPSTSIAHATEYILGGSTPKIIYSIVYLSLIIIFYYSVRESVEKNISLFATLLLALTPSLYSHSTIAYTNLTYTVFFVAAVLYLYRWYKEDKTHLWLFSALLLSFSVWVRALEPFYVFPLAIMIYVAFKRRKFKIILFSLILVIGIKLFWTYYVNSQFTSITNWTNTYSPARGVFDAFGDLSKRRLHEISLFIYKGLGGYYTILIIYILSIVLDIIFKRKNFIVTGIIALVLLTVIPGVVLISQNEPEWQSKFGSLNRMLMFVTPLIMFNVSTNEKFIDKIKLLIKSLCKSE